jgi:hypothetical protein
MLPFRRLWRLSYPGVWHELTKNNSSDLSLKAFEILCATESYPSNNFLPCVRPHSPLTPDSSTDAVDTAFSRHSVSKLPSAEPSKLQPILSAAELFGAPSRSTKSHLSRPHVRRADMDFHSSSLPSSRTKQVSSTSTVSTEGSLLFSSAIPHPAPDLELNLSSFQLQPVVMPLKRVEFSSATATKRRSGSGF